jgi:hypothetical protein
MVDWYPCSFYYHATYRCFVLEDREILNITKLLLSVDRTKLVRFGVYIRDIYARARRCGATSVQVYWTRRIGSGGLETEHMGEILLKYGAAT